MTFEPWDIVVVPFPFTDRPESKRRPALVLSTESFNRGGHTVLAMITSAPRQAWPADTRIADLAAAGLRGPAAVRLKLFTLDNRLLLRRVGHLSAADRKLVTQNLRGVLL